MVLNFKWPIFGQKILIILIFGIIIGTCVFMKITQEAKADLDDFMLEETSSLSIFHENTLLGTYNPANPDPKIIRKINVVITGYSSTPGQTDDTPFITAAGTQVRDGIIANNYFPIGTRVRIPSLYGDKIFVVEDRMSWKKGNYHFDIWFSSYNDALNFGAKRTYIEILEG